MKYAGIRPGETLGRFHDRMKAEAVADARRPRFTPPLSRADEQAVDKAVNPFGALSYTATPVVAAVPDGSATARQLYAGASPNPSPENDAAAWTRPYQYTQQSDGAPGVFGGHSDAFQAGARAIEGSARQDAQLSQRGNRAGDFTAEPVSPFDRGAPVRLADIGKAVRDLGIYKELAASSDLQLAGEAKRRVAALERAIDSDRRARFAAAPTRKSRKRPKSSKAVSQPDWLMKRGKSAKPKKARKVTLPDGRSLTYR